jgi:hypothetical protein
MNYPYLIPGMQGDPASFVASTTLILGTYEKPLDARTKITIDYSKLIPAVTLSQYAFRIKPGGEPQLWIDESVLTPVSNLLTFYVSGGIAGRAYEVKVNVKTTTGETRSDTLNIQVLDDGCGSCTIVMPPPIDGYGGATSGDGSVYINTGPRFFVSGTPPVGARVLDRWYYTATGDIFDYVTNGITSYWQLAGGGEGSSGGVWGGIVKISPITPDGVTTVFALASLEQPVNVVGSATLFVSVDGVWQEVSTQYSAAGNEITFTEAPEADANIFMLWFTPPAPTVTP